ncbi:MAG: hypothetical protein ACU83P_07925, partial [Gammaproteobacteria bacterium]
LHFKDTFVCSVINVGTAPVLVTIELLSPDTGESLGGPYDPESDPTKLVNYSLEPGLGTYIEFRLTSGYALGYCKVTHTKDGMVRAAACAKALQNEGCQGVSEAR